MIEKEPWNLFRAAEALRGWVDSHLRAHFFSNLFGDPFGVYVRVCLGAICQWAQAANEMGSWPDIPMPVWMMSDDTREVDIKPNPTGHLAEYLSQVFTCFCSRFLVEIEHNGLSQWFCLF